MNQVEILRIYVSEQNCLMFYGKKAKCISGGRHSHSRLIKHQRNILLKFNRLESRYPTYWLPLQNQSPSECSIFRSDFVLIFFKLMSICKCRWRPYVLFLLFSAKHSGIHSYGSPHLHRSYILLAHLSADVILGNKIHYYIFINLFNFVFLFMAKKN